MRHGSLFSGIGGFDLAAEWMGWENVFHCEWEEFPRQVLKYYWPNAISYGDITESDFTIHRGRVDIISGGFPCQPYSQAGARLGTEDDRHLWPQMCRVIREVRPRWVVGENVYGLINWNGGLVLDEVISDLESEGYRAFPYVLPAVAVDAPHERNRVFIVAHSESLGRRGGNSGRSDQDGERIIRPDQQEGGAVRTETEGCGGQRVDTDSNGNGLEGSVSTQLHRQESREKGPVEECLPIYRRGVSFDQFPTQSPVCGGDDGLPTDLDGITFSKWRKESVKAYGNAVVPPLIYQLFKTIEAYENGCKP